MIYLILLLYIFEGVAIKIVRDVKKNQIIMKKARKKKINVLTGSGEIK